MVDKNYITGLVNRKLEGTDNFLVDIKMSPSRIAVFIDKPSGISINECALVSRCLYNELDEKVRDTHELEVSSPGMSEPLKVHRQYLRRIGQQLHVIDLAGSEHNGILTRADQNGFTLEKSKIIKDRKKKIEQKEEMHFSYDNVKQAKLVF